MRFSLRSLFASVFMISIVLATGSLGLLPMLSFGAPLAFLATQIHWRNRRSIAWTWHTWLAFGTVMGVGAVTWIKLGRPCDGRTWLVYLGAFAWFLALDVVLRRCGVLRAASILVAIPFSYFIWCPYQGRGYDLQSGMTATALYPSLAFGECGKNSRLIEHYLGRHTPFWTFSGVFNYARETEDGVNSHSIVFDPGLEEALMLLPTADSRTQVLECLTEPRNLARVHQGLILACLYCKGYPTELRAHEWWQHNGKAFVIVTDAEKAAEMVIGWRRRCKELLNSSSGANNDKLVTLKRQLDAAYSQEQGLAGSDTSFSEAFLLVSLRDGNERQGMQLVWWE